MNTTTVESDEWLMGRVRRGDRESLEKLVRRYASPLLTFIQRMIGDAHRAEELFQETFLRVWSKRRQYRLENTFKGWLFTIAANRCRDDFRKRSPRFVEHVEPDSEDEEGNPATTAVRTETATIVAEAVARLPPQQRMAVVLRIWNGLSFAEIAAVVDSPVGTVRSNMHRALASLRGRLEPRLK